MNTFFWKLAILIIEVFLCALFSNASLERLSSKMNLIKTTLCNHLTNDSLNSSYVLIVADCRYKVFMMNNLKNVLITGLMQKIVI